MTQVIPKPVTAAHDAALLRLVNMIQQTNLNALDATLRETKGKSYIVAAARIGDISYRITRALREVRLAL